MTQARGKEIVEKKMTNKKNLGYIIKLLNPLN